MEKLMYNLELSVSSPTLNLTKCSGQVKGSASERLLTRMNEEYLAKALMQGS